MAYGFMDPRNPYPFGYVPAQPNALNALAAKPASAEQGYLPMPPGGSMNPGYRDPFGRVGVDPVQAAQPKRLRGATGAVTNTAPTPRPAPSTDEMVPGEAGPPNIPSGAQAQVAATALQQAQNLTPEQRAASASQEAALRRYQYGLAGLGFDADSADQLQAFGSTFAKPKVNRSGASRINSALSGAAEGYTAGRAMRDRKTIAETVKQLRDQYANQGRAQAYADQATAGQKDPQTSGVDMTGWDPEEDLRKQLADEEERKRLEFYGLGADPETGNPFGLI